MYKLRKIFIGCGFPSRKRNAGNLSLITNYIENFFKTRRIKLAFNLFLGTGSITETAFDIAGRGMASAVSMKEAIRLAAMYCGSYRA